MQNIIEIDGKKYTQTIEPYIEPKEETPDLSYKDKKIVLEIGHGTNGDNGAIDPRSGTTEHFLNIEAAYSAKHALESFGFTNIVVTDDKQDLWNIGFNAARDASVFVSIHHNAFNGKAQGSECLYSPKGNEDDIRLASIVSAKCSEFLGFRNRGAKKMALSILSGATYNRFKDLEGAVLAEGYFLDGPLDTAGGYEWESLTEASKKYGQALADGINEFLKGS